MNQNTTPAAAKRQMPVFYKALLAITALLLVLTVAGGATLYSYLKDYDAADPQTEAAAVYKTYFSNNDFTALLERSVENEAERAAIGEAITALINGQTPTYSLRRADAKTTTYVVSVNGSVFAEFSLVPDQTLSFSRHTWKLSELKLRLNGESVTTETAPVDTKCEETAEVGVMSHPVTISVPVSLVPQIEGVSLNEATVQTEPAVLTQHLPAGVTNPSLYYNIYRFMLKTKTPDILLVDAAGNTYKPAYNKDTDLYYYDDFSLGGGKEEEALYAQHAIDTERIIESFYAYDDHNNEALRRVVKTSALYEELFALAAPKTPFPHDGATFTDATASSFIRHDANTISCRVTMTHTLTNSADGTQHVEYNDVTLVLCDNGTGTYLVYDRYANK